jgi:hypothetical protein
MSFVEKFLLRLLQEMATLFRVFIHNYVQQHYFFQVDGKHDECKSKSFICNFNLTYTVVPVPTLKPSILALLRMIAYCSRENVPHNDRCENS